jgi:hypothetical protein
VDRVLGVGGATQHLERDGEQPWREAVVQLGERLRVAGLDALQVVLIALRRHATAPRVRPAGR